MIKRVYMSRIDAVGAQEILHVIWADRVLEYVMEREGGRVKGYEDVRMRCMDRCKWRLS